MCNNDERLQQYNQYYSSAYYANEATPPPIQSLYLFLRSFIVNKAYDSPTFIISFVTAIVAILLFRTPFKRNQLINSVYFYLSSITLLLTRLRLVFFKKSPSFHILGGDSNPTYLIKSSEIEPAFLLEEEYPDGWLYFDPVHGLIQKQSQWQIKEENIESNVEEKK